MRLSPVTQDSGRRAVLVHPLDLGSAMKVKVLEAMAREVPVVTSSAGSKRVETESVLVSGDHRLAAIELAHDADACRDRGAAHTTFLSHYLPAPVTVPLVNLYTRVAETV